MQKTELTSRLSLGLQRYRLFAIAVSSISIAQGDFSVLDWENTIVGERHAEGVAAEVVEDGLGRAERLRWSFVETQPSQQSPQARFFCSTSLNLMVTPQVVQTMSPVGFS